MGVRRVMSSNRPRGCGLALAAILATLATGLLTACGDSSSDANLIGGFGPPRHGFADAGAGPGGSGGGGALDPGGMGGTPLPPEVETEITLALPQSSQRYVYAANPEGGTVAIIDAKTLAIQTLETGVRPTYLRTLAGTDDAIVLNIGTNEATVIRQPAKGARTHTVDVIEDANSIGVAPDGKHAVVWFDSSVPGAPNNSASIQTISVLKLAAGADEEVQMTVGFRPRAVFFSTDSKAAYVVNEDGVSVLAFADIDAKGSGIARLVPLGADLDKLAADVAVTSDGRFALAREPGKSSLSLVDLASGAIRRLQLEQLAGVVKLQMAAAEAAAMDGQDAGAPPEPPPVEVTDLDLAPDGTFALAVLRNQRAMLRIPMPDGFDNPKAVKVVEVEGEVIGSATISATSDRALLYTTATAAERITIVDFANGNALRTVALRKTVEAVAVAPDGETALIVHKKADGDPNQGGLDPDTAIDRSFGYSVLRLDSGQVKLQVTATTPGSFTLVPDSTFLFIVFRDDAADVRELHQVDMKSFLVKPFPLGSPPVSVGTVQSVTRVFVSQDHADGRITFIDWQTGEARTVTGFELNSRIRD